MNASEFVKRRDEILAPIPPEFHQLTLAAAWRDGMTDENTLIELQRQVRLTSDAVIRYTNRVAKLVVDKHRRRFE